LIAVPRTADTASQLTTIRLPGEPQFGILEVTFLSGVHRLGWPAGFPLYDPFGTARSTAFDHRGSGIVARDRPQCRCIHPAQCVVPGSTDRVRPSSFLQIYPRFEGWFTGAAQ